MRVLLPFPSKNEGASGYTGGVLGRSQLLSRNLRPLAEIEEGGEAYP